MPDPASRGPGQTRPDSGALDHRQLTATLSDDTRRRLTALSDRQGAVAVTAHWGALVLTGALIVAQIPVWWFVLLPHGVLLIFLFTLLHETSHRTAFAAPRANKIVGMVCGFLLLIPPLWFRYFHLAHHRHTHDPDNDPELSSPKPETALQYAWHVSGLPVWWGQIRTFLGLLAGRANANYLPPNARPRIVAQARLMAVVYGVLIAGSLGLSNPVLFWLWVVPALLGQPFLRLYLLAEHGRCPHVANMFANTRTTFTNRAIRRLAWNMPYHAEHHAYPAVPFHRLPYFHEIARAHLLVTENGYARFNRRYFAAITTGERVSST